MVRHCGDATPGMGSIQWGQGCTPARAPDAWSGGKTTHSGRNAPGCESTRLALGAVPRPRHGWSRADAQQGRSHCRGLHPPGGHLQSHRARRVRRHHWRARRAQPPEDGFSPPGTCSTSCACRRTAPGATRAAGATPSSSTAISPPTSATARKGRVAPPAGHRPRHHPAGARRRSVRTPARRTLAPATGHKPGA